MHLREAIRHLLQWGVTREAGVQAVPPTWEHLAAAVPAGFRVAVGDLVEAVDVAAAAVGVAVADGDNGENLVARTFN